MNYNKKVYNFAAKWIEKFKDNNTNYLELIDRYVADDCSSLGFEMDCGHAFEHIYGKAVYDSNELAKIINEITDIALLGSAIYSRWRYFNHWAYHGAEILEPKNREWFILTLNRLMLLTSKDAYVFYGIPKKVRIVSNNIGYGPCPNQDDEVEQHLTLNTKGRVWFSAYSFENENGKFYKIRSNNFSIDKSKALDILTKVSSYFNKEYDELFATDIGSWVLEITNTEGKIYKFHGSLCADFKVDEMDLSDLIRKNLNMNDLYVFDGNN